MRSISCLILSLLLVISASAQKKQAAVDKRIQGLDTALSKLVGDWKAAGFAVAVVEKNKVVYAKGFGYRDYENKKPVTPNTLFAIGSSTKAFTSSLLGMLAKDGKLKLDDKATDHLTDLRFYNEEMNKNITIRDLMTHRTGLPRHDLSWYLFNSESRDSLKQRIKHMEPSVGIRQAFQYNNFMFLLQGMIAEKYYGKSWEEAIRENILKPLDMKRTAMTIDEMVKDDDIAIGYRLLRDSIIRKTDYYRIKGMAPAGSINSSVTEVANWLITWINGGKFNGKEIIPAAYYTDAISSQMVIGPGIPATYNQYTLFSNYGLGWFLTSYRGHYRVEHGGNIDGFTASVAFYPTDSIGIVVLANQDGSNIPSVARNIIADRMLKLPYVNWHGNMLKDYKESLSAASKVESSRIPNTKPSHELAAYEGVYTHPGYGPFEVYIENDSLKARAGFRNLWLRHYHYDVFGIQPFENEDGIDTTKFEEPPIKIVFHTGSSGKIESLSQRLEGTLEPIVFKWQPRAKPMDTTQMAKYVGEFELEGMTVKTYIKNEILHLLVPGQPEYELAFAGNHTFSLKIISGFSVQFILDDNEAVTAAKFIQPNGIFTATKKK